MQSEPPNCWEVAPSQNANTIFVSFSGIYPWHWHQWPFVLVLFLTWKWTALMKHMSRVQAGIFLEVSLSLISKKFWINGNVWQQCTNQPRPQGVVSYAKANVDLKGALPANFDSNKTSCQFSKKNTVWILKNEPFEGFIFLHKVVEGEFDVNWRC